MSLCPHHNKRIISCIIPDITLLLFGCAGVVSKDAPQPVNSIVSDTEDLVASKAYAAAAKHYAIVTAEATTVGKHHLRRGELLERVDEDKDARQFYKEALDANHLYKLDEAKTYSSSFPATHRAL